MNKKVAVVTGGNRGIGLEICRQLGKLGMTVVLTARDEEKGARAYRVLKEYGIDIHFLALDVTSEESILRFATNVEQQFGKLDVLINNAGVYLDGEKSVLNIDLNTMRKTMETNVYGPLRLVQVLTPLLQKSKDGRVINVSSGMGEMCSLNASSPAYSLSKLALNAVTIQLADELGMDGITVNAMCPGWVKTDMGGQNAPRSVEKGAETAVWLATTTIKYTGKFFRDQEEISM